MRRLHSGSRIVRDAALGGGLILALVLASPAAAQAPPLARYVPGDDLIAYVEFAGLDAHAEAWQKTVASKLLTETNLGALLEDLVRQVADQDNAPDAEKMTGREVVTLIKHVSRNGFALGFRLRRGARAPEVVLAVRGAGREAVRRLFTRLFDGPRGPMETVAKGDRRVHRSTAGPPGQATSWWFEGDDLIFASPPDENLDAVLAAIDGQGPNAVDHPRRAALARAEDGFEPALLAFLDLAQLPPLPPQAAQLGLDGLRRVEFRGGFQDDALMSVLQFVAPAPRRGLLALLDGPTFDAATLPPLPADASGFTVVSVEAETLYDRIVALRQATDPNAGAQAEAAEAAFLKNTGVRLREDVLRRLGPKAAILLRPGTGPAVPYPGTGMMVRFPEVTIIAQNDDPAALGRTLDTLAERANQGLEAAPGNQRAPGRPLPQFRKIPGREPGYVLDFPPGVLQPGSILEGISPALFLGKDYVVVSSTGEAARAALAATARGRAWTPSPDFETLARRLPARMVLLTVNDPRETLPALVASLPAILRSIQEQAGAARQAAARASGRPAPPAGPAVAIDPDQVPPAEELRRRLFPGSLAVAVDDQGLRVVTREAFPSVTSPAASGVAVALLLPAVQAAREAARRAQCTNNLKMIGLAMHNYHSANDTFPPPAIRGKDGTPLLSWRVAILPYIEQMALYEQFHLDEPWDSPHNRALLASMPGTYTCPSRPGEPGMTFYRAFTGPGAAFEGPAGQPLAAFVDGTTTTLLVVEAKEPVPWTKPDELPLAADALARSGSAHSGGFNALFADGAVKFLKSSIDAQVFRALLTRNGGEVIGND